MNRHQRYALKHHCRLAGECVKREFAYARPSDGISVVLTVNSGYE
jgi:hypothetical protein